MWPIVNIGPSQAKYFTTHTYLHFQVAISDHDDNISVEEVAEKPVMHQYLPVHSPKLPRVESTERYVVMKHDTKGFRRS